MRECSYTSQFDIARGGGRGVVAVSLVLAYPVDVETECHREARNCQRPDCKGYDEEGGEVLAVVAHCWM